MIAWRLRQERRTAVGAIATGARAEALARKMLASPDDVLGRWRGVTAKDAIVILGEEETLPWIDGIAYLSRDERAPLLLLPTLHDPDVPLDLFERAIVRHDSARSPFAVFDDRVISICEARSVSRKKVAEWLAAR